MGMAANVLSIQVLDDLKTALARFGGEAQEALNAAQLEIRRTLDWLAERLKYWQNEVRRRQQILAQAKAALARCRASGFRDPNAGAYREPPCTCEWETVRRAEASLREAEAELRNVQHWQHVVDQAATAYGREAGRMATQLNQEQPRARALLGRKMATLQAYVLTHAPATPAKSVRDYRGTVPSATTSPAGIPTAATAATFVEIAALPPGGTPTRGAAAPSHIQNVSIEQIDLNDTNVKTAADFHKTSHEVMVDGFDKLATIVQPAVAQGADGDYFRNTDACQGLDYEHGCQRVYDAFYGTDAITVEPVGDRYQVLNGYHRLFVARELGIRDVPARIMPGRQP